MPKILKSNIVAILILLIAVALGVGIGVAATSNENKKLDFDLAVQYTAEFFVKVELGLDKNKNGAIEDSEYITVFNSSTPTDVEYHSAYVKNIIGGTLSLNSELFQADSNGDVKLKITNVGDNPFLARVGLEDSIPLATNGASSTVSINTADKLLGVWLLNVQFDSLPECSVTFNDNSGLLVGYSVTIYNLSNFSNNVDSFQVRWMNEENHPFVYKFNYGDKLIISLWSGSEIYYAFASFSVTSSEITENDFTSTYNNGFIVKYEMKTAKSITSNIVITAGVVHALD